MISSLRLVPPVVTTTRACGQCQAHFTIIGYGTPENPAPLSMCYVYQAHFCLHQRLEAKDEKGDIMNKWFSYYQGKSEGA